MSRNEEEISTIVLQLFNRIENNTPIIIVKEYETINARIYR